MPGPLVFGGVCEVEVEVELDVELELDEEEEDDDDDEDDEDEDDEVVDVVVGEVVVVVVLGVQDSSTAVAPAGKPGIADSGVPAGRSRFSEIGLPGHQLDRHDACISGRNRQHGDGLHSEHGAHCGKQNRQLSASQHSDLAPPAIRRAPRERAALVRLRKMDATDCFEALQRRTVRGGNPYFLRGAGRPESSQANDTFRIGAFQTRL